MNIDIKCEYEQLVPVKDLKPNPKNPNKRPAAQADELAFLIKAHGWRVPIIVSTRSGMIVAGHGRLMAAKLLEMESVPVDYQDFESDELEYAFLTSDNAISEWSAIDRAMVNDALPDLGPDFDIRLLGLENFTLDVSEKDEKKTKDENSEEPPEEPEKLFGQTQIFNGDSAQVLRNLDDNSVDSIVTDPPYGFAFMGKAWDYELPSPEIWKECFRVLKPGGHLLAFGGPRTYHRLACGVEDAGFEIRDQIQWLFGSGFPKSLDISKAIDKAAGAEREITGTARGHVDANGVHDDDNYEWKPIYDRRDTPATDAAKQWDGWGTALKPANEPIVLARKPLSEKTVAANVLKWGTGGLNIDGTRVGTDDVRCVKAGGGGKTFHGATEAARVSGSSSGRFPANLILDEESARLLDLQTGDLGKSAGASRGAGGQNGKLSPIGAQDIPLGFGDTGGASRFFYVAKASKSERNEHCEELEGGRITDGRNGVADFPKQRDVAVRANHHPTVKPVSLMRYLCKLVTPPNGIVLDPFMGSGSTGVGALQAQFKFIGIEREPEYFEICKKRLNHDANQTNLIG